MKTYELTRLLQTAAVLYAIGIMSAAQAAAIVVNLEVNANQTKLVPTTPGNCASNNAPGSTYANMLYLAGGVENLRVQSCVFSGPTSASSTNQCAIIASSSLLFAAAISERNAAWQLIKRHRIDLLAKP